MADSLSVKKGRGWEMGRVSRRKFWYQRRRDAGTQGLVDTEHHTLREAEAHLSNNPHKEQSSSTLPRLDGLVRILDAGRRKCGRLVALLRWRKRKTDGQRIPKKGEERQKKRRDEPAVRGRQSRPCHRWQRGRCRGATGRATCS